MALTEQQRVERLTGVGASEILAALGQDPRCTRLELYKRKRGEMPERDFSGDDRIHFGQLFEPVLRKEFARRTGLRVIQRHVTLRHRSAPLVGHVDGWIQSVREGVEIKTADRYEADEFGEPGTDRVPVRYWLQCAGYMAITGANRWHLAALIGGNDFRTYILERNAEIEQFILDGIAKFWEHVERCDPPEPTTPKDIRLRWPKDLGTSIVANEEVLASVARLAEAKLNAKEWEAQCEAHEMLIQNFMQEHAQLLDADGNVLVTWRAAKPSMRFDEKRFADEHPTLHMVYKRAVSGSRRFLLK